jgi:hypothetical protein
MPGWPVKGAVAANLRNSRSSFGDRQNLAEKSFPPGKAIGQIFQALFVPPQE